MPRGRPATTRTRRTREAPVVEPFFVKVARVGGSVQDVCLNGNKTVESALEAAGLSADGSIRVNGRLAEMSSVLQNGDIITVAGKIAGGNS